MHAKHRSLEYDLKYIDNHVSLIEEPYRGNPSHAGFHDTVYYSSLGKIDSFVHYIHDGPSISFRVNGTYFSYNSDGIPVKIIRTSDYPSIPNWEYNYTVTQGNITQAVGEFDLTGLATRHFSYDDNTNYLKKFPEEFYFVSLKVLGVLNSSGQELAPFNFSGNNVIDYNGTPITYQTDGNGRLTELKAGTKYRITYEYECP